MPAVSIQVTSKIVRKGLENLRKKIPLISRARLKETADAIKREMRAEYEKPTYPIKWDSKKQRIAYFATDAFTYSRENPKPKGQKNTHIPYKRTHKARKAWKVIKTETGYDVFNPLSHTQYLYGRSSGAGQSKIHKGRAPLFKTVYEKYIAKLPKTVVAHLKTIARREGFTVT